jgi:hypothetical protein
MPKKPYRREKVRRNILILQLYENSELTVKEIGKRYNLTGSRITSIAQENGAEPRSSKYVKAMDNIEINQPAIIFDDTNCTIISTKKENYCKKRQRILMLAYRRNFQLHTYHFNNKLYVWRIK